MSARPNPLAVDCPVCGARPGRSCVLVVRGNPIRELPAPRSHRARVHLAAGDQRASETKETPSR
jgi:hypothetical protein